MSRVPCACKRLQAHPVKRVYPPWPVPTIGDPPLLDRMAEVVRTALGPAADVAVARLERRWPDAESALRRVYGAELDPLVDVIGEVMAAALAARSPDLKGLDHRREAVPDWYQQPRMVGYVCYTDRFAGDLRGLSQRLDYLAELGVTYLHLMPLLRTWPGENDGGYAVQAYDEVEPALGSIDDLDALAAELRRRGMSLCIDVVMNHTAREHLWARKARTGDPTFRADFYFFPDRELPDAYERTLREVFPDFAPGNFTWLADIDQWVWTTFHEYQWDLDYANPEVFGAISPSCANSPTEASRSCASTPRRSSGSGSAPTARTSPRCTTSSWPSAPCWRSWPPRWC